jgi:hypothetical protein
MTLLREDEVESFLGFAKERKALEDIVLNLVLGFYEEYYKSVQNGLRLKEPKITASYLRDEIDASGNDYLKNLPEYLKRDTKRRSCIVKSSLETLRRKGLLKVSIGISVYSSFRQVKLYSPSDFNDRYGDAKARRLSIT